MVAIAPVPFPTGNRNIPNKTDNNLHKKQALYVNTQNKTRPGGTARHTV